MQFHATFRFFGLLCPTHGSGRPNPVSGMTRPITALTNQTLTVTHYPLQPTAPCWCCILPAALAVGAMLLGGGITGLGLSGIRAVIPSAGSAVLRPDYCLWVLLITPGWERWISATSYLKYLQGPQSNAIRSFLCFPCVFHVQLEIFPAPISEMCDNLMRETFFEKKKITANITISGIFRIRDFNT